MNKDPILKNTQSYEEWLVEQLKDPKEAHFYLEAALEAYEEDGDTTALLLALRSVAYARGGIGLLAKRTGMNREHLYEVLAGKHNPRLDNLLAIFSSLGFRVRLERASVSNVPAATP